MSYSSDASWGLWTDYSRGPLDRWQILATDYWAQWMSAFVAVCLTLINPYLFKIAKSFLGWLVSLVDDLRAPATQHHSAPPSHSSDETQALLSQDQPDYDGAIQQSRSNRKLAKLGKRRSFSNADRRAEEDAECISPSAHNDYDDEGLKHESSFGDAASSESTSLPTSQAKDKLPVFESNGSASKPSDQRPSHQESNKEPRSSTASGPSNSPLHSSLQALQRNENVERRPHSAHRVEGPAETLAHSNDSREIVWGLIRSIVHGGIDLSGTTFAIVLTTALFGLFVAQTIAGIFSARIASDRAALLSSANCGIWEFNYRAGDEAGDRDDRYTKEKEARASQYARKCYSPPGPINSLGCNFFYNQSIDYQVTYGQICPFQSPELCLNGLYSAVTFDTGYVDAGIIGIHAPTTHKFRRRTSCSPLSMTEPYVQGQSSGGPHNTTYRYYYGITDNANFTFHTSGNPFQWLVPVYSIFTYFSSLYPKSDYWQPLPELKPSSNSTLTMIFVSSNHVYHDKPSSDPIFPAITPRYFRSEREPYYYNSDPRARALACADSTELCSPDGSRCWSMTDPLPYDEPNTAAYWLMKLALENSNIYDSIKWRLGTALLAQESVSQSVSRPLPQKQWAIEVSQLFATSLARIQYDAWGIARGEDRERPGYVDVTPDEARGRLCRLYKFNSTGYTNVNLLAFIGLPLAAFAVFILSCDACSFSWGTRHTPARLASAPGGEREVSEPLVVDRIARLLARGAERGLVNTYRCLASLGRSVKGRWALWRSRRDGLDVEES